MECYQADTDGEHVSIRVFHTRNFITHMRQKLTVGREVSGGGEKVGTARTTQTALTAIHARACKNELPQ